MKYVCVENSGLGGVIMKKRQNKILISFSFIIIFCGGILLWRIYKRPHISKEIIPVFDKQIDYHPMNNSQYLASVWMGVYDHKLWILPQCGDSIQRTEYDGWLCCFQNEKLQKLTRLADGKQQYPFWKDQFLYYWKLTYTNCYLYCYNLAQKRETVLYKTMDFPQVNPSLSSQGFIYMPVSTKTDDQIEYLLIDQEEIKQVQNDREGVVFHGTEYKIQLHDTVSTASKATLTWGTENRYQLGLARTRAMITTEKGLLIHNEGYQQLLYKVDHSGEIQCIFSVPCMDSESALTCVGNYAYLSLKRFEGFGDYGSKRFENDQMEGTWRINIEDGSKEKISELIFDGMYVFDDRYIWACTDECSIYRLDTSNGSIDALMTVK